MVDGWLRVLMRGENCPIDERHERQRQSEDRALHPAPPEVSRPSTGAPDASISLPQFLQIRSRSLIRGAPWKAFLAQLHSLGIQQIPRDDDPPFVHGVTFPDLNFLTTRRSPHITVRLPINRMSLRRQAVTQPNRAAHSCVPTGGPENFLQLHEYGSP